MDGLWRDVKLGVRMLVQHPGFSLVAVLALALGIGGNAAIFTLINALLFRPRAYEQPERLVGVYSKSLVTPDAYRAFSYPNYADLRDRTQAFSGLLAHNLAMVGVAEDGTTRRALADIVSANYFSTLGVELFQGRPFLPGEEAPGSSVPVAIVSHQYWQRAGHDPNLVGSKLEVNGRTFTVVGIAPRGFSGTTVVFGPELWLPLGMFEALSNDFDGERRPLAERDHHCLVVAGRLRPGSSVGAAEAELAVLATNLRTAFPEVNRDQTLTVASLSRVSTSTAPARDHELSTVAVLLMSMAGVVLLIACLNLANMLLARNTGRRKEFAIRLAIGGGRGQVVRQLLIEGFVLSLAGGLVGSLLAFAANRLLLSSLTAMLPIPIVFPLVPDVRTFAALFGFCAVSTLLFGLGPAWQLARPGLSNGLREIGGQSAATRRLNRAFAPRNLLVVGQLALSMVLLTAAGLFVRGALEAARPDLGFPIERGVIVEFDAGLAGYDETVGRELYRRVVERLGALPGVESASLAATVPFGMVSLGDRVTRAEASAQEEASGARGAQLNIVGADYFRALGVGLLRGRRFSAAEEEAASAAPVAIVDRRLAELLWPGEDALGRRLRLARRAGADLEIVGIAPDLHQHLFEGQDRGAIFLPLGGNYQSNMHVQLRTVALASGRARALLELVRSEIRGIDARLPILGIRTLDGQLDASIELWLLRTAGRLFAAFGLLALLLAAVGAYGVRAYAVGQRAREIGIRMALGADERRTVRLVLGEGLRLILFGLGTGVALALAVARLLSSLLYRVSAVDPMVFVAAPSLLAAVIGLACYLPARRAARVDPAVVLRCE